MIWPFFLFIVVTAAGSLLDAELMILPATVISIIAHIIAFIRNCNNFVVEHVHRTTLMNMQSARAGAASHGNGRGMHIGVYVDCSSKYALPWHNERFMAVIF